MSGRAVQHDDSDGQVVHLPRSASVGPAGQQLEPGSWGKDDQGMVWVRCPHAHHRVGIIYRGMPNPHFWQIADDGRVTPSVHFKDPTCGWHKVLVLDGWEPPR